MLGRLGYDATSRRREDREVSDYAELLQAEAELSRAVRARHSHNANRLDDLEFPPLKDWEADHFWLISVALLEKSPQPINELEYRTRLSSREMLLALLRRAKEFPREIIVHNILTDARFPLEQLEGQDLQLVVLTGLSYASAEAERKVKAHILEERCSKVIDARRQMEKLATL